MPRLISPPPSVDSVLFPRSPFFYIPTASFPLRSHTLIWNWAHQLFTNWPCILWSNCHIFKLSSHTFIWSWARHPFTNWPHILRFGTELTILLQTDLKGMTPSLANKQIYTKVKWAKGSESKLARLLNAQDLSPILPAIPLDFSVVRIRLRVNCLVCFHHC